MCFPNRVDHHQTIFSFSLVSSIFSIDMFSDTSEFFYEDPDPNLTTVYQPMYSFDHEATVPYFSYEQMYFYQPIYLPPLEPQQVDFLNAYENYGQVEENSCPVQKVPKEVVNKDKK